MITRSISKEISISSARFGPGWFESLQDTFGALTSYNMNSESIKGD
jgi:hypothetical protein